MQLIITREHVVSGAGSGPCPTASHSRSTTQGSPSGDASPVARSSAIYALDIPSDGMTLEALYAAVTRGERASNSKPPPRGGLDVALRHGNRRLPRTGASLASYGVEHGSVIRVGYGSGLQGGLMIKVRTLTGKEIEIDIEPTDTTERIKERVEEKEGIPPVQQRLIFAGKQMGEGKTAKDYNIEGGTVLHLVLALRGGR